MDDLEVVSLDKAGTIKGGEAITLTVVLTYLAVSILTVVVWKLFTSTKAKVSLPGGALFEWTGSSSMPSPIDVI